MLLLADEKELFCRFDETKHLLRVHCNPAPRLKRRLKQFYHNQEVQLKGSNCKAEIN